MNQPVFILGAGFNVDTTPWSGCGRYPLLTDLARECFGVSHLPAGKSIEDLFQDSIDQRNQKPVEKLAELLLRPDYYVSGSLLKPANPSNPYTAFITRFPTAPILTFNYDGLVEILALHYGQWRPDDGFGVPVLVIQWIPKGTSFANWVNAGFEGLETRTMESKFVICLSNRGFEAALEPRKIYRSLRDPVAESEGLVRIEDESGEDYLYPASMFEPISVPKRAAKAFASAT